MTESNLGDSDTKSKINSFFIYWSWTKLTNERWYCGIHATTKTCSVKKQIFKSDGDEDDLILFLVDG